MSQSPQTTADTDTTRPDAEPQEPQERQGAQEPQEVTTPAGDGSGDGSGSTAAPKPAKRVLRNMSEIRTFFRTNETPIFFMGPTAFNLLGVDRVMAASRTPQIYADAAHAVLTKAARSYSGQTLMVEDVLEAGPTKG